MSLGLQQLTSRVYSLESLPPGSGFYKIEGDQVVRTGLDEGESLSTVCGKLQAQATKLETEGLSCKSLQDRITRIQTRPGQVKGWAAQFEKTTSIYASIGDEKQLPSARKGSLSPNPLARASVTENRPVLLAAATSNASNTSSSAAAIPNQNFDPQAQIFINAVSKDQHIYKNPKTGLLVEQEEPGVVTISHSDAWALAQKHLELKQIELNQINPQSNEIKDQILISSKEVTKLGLIVLEKELLKFEDFATNVTNQVIVTPQTKLGLHTGFKMQCAQVRNFALSLKPTSKGGLLPVEELETLNPQIESLNQRLKNIHQSMSTKMLSSSEVDTCLEKHLALFAGSKELLDGISSFGGNLTDQIENCQGSFYLLRSSQINDFKKIFYDSRELLSGANGLEDQIAKAYNRGELTYQAYADLIKKTRMARLTLVSKIRGSEIYKSSLKGKDDQLSRDLQKLEDFATERLKMAPVKKDTSEQKS